VTGPTTLVVDTGGTSIKAGVFDDVDRPMAEPVRVPTTYPLGPDDLVATVVGIAETLPESDRVSVGFPGVVRDGRVLTAPAFVARAGLGSTVSPDLLHAWTGFDLGGALSQKLGRPTRLANDADLQGLAVVEGLGLELVVTLGAGFGTALLRDGELCPHMEFAHDLFREGETYNEQLGDAARQRVGAEEWTGRVQLALDALYRLLMFDRVWVLGGNAQLLTAGLSAGLTDTRPGDRDGARAHRGARDVPRSLCRGVRRGRVHDPRLRPLRLRCERRRAPPVPRPEPPARGLPGCHRLAGRRPVGRCRTHRHLGVELLGR